MNIQNSTALARLTKDHTALLKSSKAKSIGPVESLLMKHIGRKDGTNGLPYGDKDLVWNSPALDKEQNRFHEFCSKVWGDLQIAAGDDYVSLANTVETILLKELHLADLKESQAASPTNTVSVARKHGEEELSDSQVLARRKRESERKKAKLLNQISQSEKEIDDLYQTLALYYDSIAEANHATHMVCERVKDHTLQRIDKYWNAAYLDHPDKQSMPVIPTIDLPHKSEEVYFEQHLPLLRKVEALLRKKHEEMNPEVAS